MDSLPLVVVEDVIQVLILSAEVNWWWW